MSTSSTPWSKTWPTTPGWYWTRRNGRVEPGRVRIGGRGKTFPVYIVYGSYVFPDERCWSDMEWGPAITQPVDVPPCAREIIDIDGSRFVVDFDGEGKATLNGRAVELRVELITATTISIYDDGHLVAREISRVDDVRPSGWTDLPEGRWMSR